MGVFAVPVALAAVHGEDLAGDVVGLYQELDGLAHLVGRAPPAEKRLAGHSLVGGVVIVGRAQSRDPGPRR